MGIKKIKESLFRLLRNDLDLGYIVDIIKKNLSIRLKLKMIFSEIKKTEDYEFIVFLTKLTAWISVVFPIVFQLIYLKTLDVTRLDYNTFMQIPILFVSIFPIIVIARKNLIFKDGVFKALLLILYYIIFMPVIIIIFGLNIEKIGGERYGDLYILVFAVNIFLLFTSHIVLIKYCVTDIILNRRKVKSSDIIITLMTYITLGISFGALYSVINLCYDGLAFHGMKDVHTTLYFYFKHIYFSFVTLTTLGYGDIYPVNFWGEFFVILESLTGIFLLNFSLGITLSSGILNLKQNETNKESKKVGETKKNEK